jgi:hypothetical protein
MNKIIQAVLVALGVAVLGTAVGEADAHGGRSSGGSRPASYYGSSHRPYSYYHHHRVFYGHNHRHFSYRYYHRSWRCYCFYYRPTRCWYYWSCVGGGCYYPMSSASVVVPGEMPPAGAMTLPDQLPPDVTPPPAPPAPPGPPSSAQSPAPPAPQPPAPKGAAPAQPDPDTDE